MHALPGFGAAEKLLVGLRRLAADFPEQIKLVGGGTQAEAVGVDMLRCREAGGAGRYALELA